MKAKWILIFILSLLLTGCSSAADTAPYPDYAPEAENRLVIYTSHKEEVWWPIVKEFEERTGIWVMVISGGTYEMLNQIQSEKDSPTADIMFGGGVDSLEAYQDCFAPYRCAESDFILKQYRSADHLWTPFSALPIVLIYNNKLVNKGELTAWKDLLSGNFRNKIAFTDPEISGSSFSSLITMLLAIDGSNTEVIYSFVENLGGQQLDDSEKILSMVADGSATVGITLEESAWKQVAAGANISVVYPADGTNAVPDGSALVKNAPHEDNAKLFIDFTVSTDVQELIGQSYRRPVRSDVDIPSDLPATDSIPLVDSDWHALSARREEILSVWTACIEGENTP